MWTHAQKMISDSWSAAAGPLVQAHADKVLAWEAWVNNALAQQREWSQNVAARAAEWPGVPRPVGSMIEQSNGRLLALQGELWTRWFELLKRQPGVEAPAAPRAPAKAAKAKPAPAKKAPVEAKAPVAMKAPAAVKAPAANEIALEAEDDLCAIAGVGPAIEGKLKAAGIRTYREIAAWAPADIERVEREVLGGRFGGRIRRDDWLDQARWLHAEKYGRAV